MNNPETENAQSPSWAAYWSVRGRALWLAQREMLIDVATAFAASRVIFYTATIIAFFTIPEHPGNGWEPYNAPTHALFDASVRWDSGWYMHIAREGYDWTGPEHQSPVAFFPLYPLLLRGLLAIVDYPAIYAAAVMLNHVLYFLALIPVWHYASKFGGRPVAQRTVLLLSIFPTAFFFNAIYTESLFLLLTAGGLLAIQRASWLNAGWLGLLASLARPTGVLLAIPFVIRLWQLRHDGWQAVVRRGWPIVGVPAGIFIYMGYLTWRFQEPFAFIRVQEAWGHVRMLPSTAIIDSIRYLVNYVDRDIFFVMGMFNTAITLWAIAMVLVIVRSDLLGASFAMAAILTPLIAGIEGMPVVSMGRYMLVLFPLFVPLARWAQNWSVQTLLVTLFLPSHVLLAALFVRWYWVV